MFLLAAFLLEPALTLLFDLLFFVILVLDTMISPLYCKIFKFFVTIINDDFLPKSAQLVKIIVLGHIILSPSSASSVQFHDAPIASHYYLAIGEYKKIKFSSNSKFAISNKGTITVKSAPQNKHLLIRAKHLGNSTVLIWRNGNKSEHSFRVVSRATLTSLRMDTNKLTASGIKFKVLNDEIIITSILVSIEQVERLEYLMKKRQNSLIKINFKINISTQLQKTITARIYSTLISNGITPINCSFGLLPFTCLIEKGSSDIKNINKHWFKGIPLKLISLNRVNLSNNILLKTRIVLIESGQRSEVDLGLSSANSKVEKILDKDFASLIRNNDINLNEGLARISTVATPDIITRPNKKSQISIGSEILFSNKKNDEVYTDWKFAGLKVDSKFSKSSDIYSLEIKTELSKPNDGSITTNKLITHLNVLPGKVYKVAQLYHKGVQKEESSISYISKIPILGKLFSSNNEIETNKYISIYVEFEELK